MRKSFTAFLLVLLFTACSFGSSSSSSSSSSASTSSCGTDDTACKTDSQCEWALPVVQSFGENPSMYCYGPGTCASNSHCLQGPLLTAPRDPQSVAEPCKNPACSTYGEIIYTSMADGTACTSTFGYAGVCSGGACDTNPADAGLVYVGSSEDAGAD